MSRRITSERTVTNPGRHGLRRRARAGFTLLEMLVALVAGAMTIATAYSLGAGSSRAFREQNRINQTQAGVRSAMEQLRRDLSRAGLGATPDSGATASSGDRGSNPAGCAVTPGFRMRALQVEHNAYSDQLALADDNVVQADGLILTGNFATGDHYLVAEIVAGTTITLQQTRQSFRRSFGAPLNAQRFAEAFRVGRWVYLVSETGRRIARQISSVNGASATITVNDTISVGCFGHGRGARISPISRVEYYAASPADGNAFEWLLPRGGSSAERIARGVEQTILARRELDFVDANTAVPNSERVVLEYLAHFDVSLVLDTALGTAAPLLTEPIIDDGGAAQLDAAPARVRAARVRLAGRSSGVDANFPWAGSRADQRSSLRSYLPRLPPGMSAAQAVGQAPAAHVRSAEEVVMLENIANRGLR